MNDMTYEEVRNNFIQDLAENAYLSMCSMEEMKIVIEALDKQIPKKIIRKSKKASLEDIKCPNCQREIDAMNIVNYCTYCGQALDWSAIE
jgi:hypothetical protein